MLIQEMHIGVNLGVQKIASNIGYDFLPEEIDYYLNETIEAYVKSQYSFLKEEIHTKEGQYANENIQTVITTAEVANIAAVDYLPNAVDGDLPNDYLYYISARTKVSDKWRNNRFLSSESIQDYLTTAFNSPIFTEYPILIQNGKVIVIGDSQVTLDINTDVQLDYIKQPATVSLTDTVNCDLPSHTHKEIVDMTIKKIISIIVNSEEQ